jgi:hypothetical protein
MSYIYNKEIDFKNYQLDAFHKLRTSEMKSIIELKHVYDKNPLLVDELLNGTATSIKNPDHSDIEMNVSSNGDFVIRATKGRGIYSPGKSGQFMATFMDFHLQTNVIKRVGYFSTNNSFPYNATFDGIWLESNGSASGNNPGEISFNISQNGQTYFSCPLSGWDSSVYNPNDIDWSKNQLIFFDFQWLGVGRVRFGMETENGPVIFAQHIFSNTTVDPYMTNPNQPIRYEIRQVGAGSGGTFHQLCSVFASEGESEQLNNIVSIANTTERTLAVPGVKYPLLGYRTASAYSGANIVLESVFALNQITGTDYLITLEMNPGITGGTATWTQSPNSPVEYAQGNGTLTVNSPGIMLRSYIGKGNAATTDNYSLVDNLIKPGVCVNGTRDEVWICVTPLISSGSTKIRAITANLNYYN